MIKFFGQKNRGPAPYEARGFRSWFTLVETLVAISIFTVSLLGIMSVLASGVSNTGYAKGKMAAAYLAQEGIEYVRNLRDTDVIGYVDADGNSIGWSNYFANFTGTQTITLPNPPFYLPTGFSRTVSKQKIDSNEVKIYSKVTWTQGSGPHTITFSENLFNWVE